MEQMKRVFTVYTPRTRIGIGAAGDVGMLARELDATKSLILTSPSIVRSGLLDPVKTSLCTNSIAFDIFSECKPDAPIRLVKKCADIAKRGNYELLIGVGGGSVMDTTKAASVLTTAGEDIHSLFGFDRVEKAGIPFILIPTTAGSGSEWSEVSVVTNEVDGLKKVIYSRHIWPNAAIIDPLMSLNTPPKLTAESGMDVLCDCIESFTSWKANIISEMYSEKALRLTVDNLRIAYAKGSKHLEARYGLAIAAALALQAAMTGGGSIAHAMSYPVQMKGNISHGASVALMSPHVMVHNLIANPTKFAKVAEIMGENVAGLSQMDAARKSVEALRKYSRDLRMPQSLSEVGITKEDIPGFVDFLFEFQLYAIDHNAREVTPEDATAIFEAAL